MKLTLSLAAVCIATLATVPADAHDIVRRASSTYPIATSVSVPAGAQLLFVSGTLPGVADPSAPPGSRERIGDTSAQARSVLGKIAAELESAGLTMRDVVKLNVFLVADPKKGGAVDFAGLMSAYTTYFGKDVGGLPARTTVQVAGLPVPGALVEIEAIAAHTDDHTHE